MFGKVGCFIVCATANLPAGGCRDRGSAQFRCLPIIAIIFYSPSSLSRPASRRKHRARAGRPRYRSAACIAALIASREDEEALVLLAPSHHTMGDKGPFLQAIETGLAATNRRLPALRRSFRPRPRARRAAGNSGSGRRRNPRRARRDRPRCRPISTSSPRDYRGSRGHTLDLAFQYATLSSQAGDYEAAISTLERMLIYAPNTPRLQVELDMLYYRIGAYEVARSYFEQALANPSTPPDAAQQIRLYLQQLALATFGKSVVYNERIDTSESGVVQVLLLDGSTFTVDMTV